MDCISSAKRKRKRKHIPVELTKLNKRWTSCNVDTDAIFSNGSNVDGFLELEELCDYDEGDIDAITKFQRKKKEGKQECEQCDEKIVDEIECDRERTSEDPQYDGVGEKQEESAKQDGDDITQGKVDDHNNEESVISNNNVMEDTTCSPRAPKKVILDKSYLEGKIDEDNSTSEGKVNENTDASTEPIVPKISKKERRKQARKLSFKLKLKERRKKFKEMKRALVKQSLGVDKICDTVITKSAEFEMKSNVRSTMNDWLGLGVPDEVIKALSENNFTTPTPIQRESLPHAIFYQQDIIGAAETGSGKTLAFGIPLIKNIMDLKKKRLDKLEAKEANDGDDDDLEDAPLYALMISPTRELAIQIKDHIDTAAKYTDVKCVAVVGGLATPKQERLLNKCPEIVVGTPGRLHKLLCDGCEHLNKFETLKFIVLDEADRMLEEGHFKEVNDILDMINRVKVKRQTFVFSATLTLPQRHKGFQKRKKEKNKDESVSEMQLLIDKVGINHKAKVIDLTPKHVTATQLQQLRVMCTNEEKDFYLVYFLMLHPGRSIVFVNSISCTRRLCSLLNIMKLDPLQLHAGKQQRQRFKYLERFTASESGLLIATDVAARGLDIPKVCNVIHYQLPKDPKVYIHRAGRTARANESGLSFILEGPEDFNALKKISVVLKLGKDISSLKVDRKILDGIKSRVLLAREIDQEEHKFRKENADTNWLKRNAKSMEIETDVTENVLTKQQKLRLTAKRKQLHNLLSEDLYPSKFSGAYPTKSGKLVTPGLQTPYNKMLSKN